MPKQATSLRVDSFVTSNKVSLGISKEDLVKILGNGYKSKVIGNTEQILYTMDSKSKFVKRYNQYRYYIKCLFKEGILIKYSFGFESV